MPAPASPLSTYPTSSTASTGRRHPAPATQAAARVSGSPSPESSRGPRMVISWPRAWRAEERHSASACLAHETWLPDGAPANERKGSVGRMGLALPTDYDDSRSRTTGMRRPLHALGAQGIIARGRHRREANVLCGLQGMALGKQKSRALELLIRSTGDPQRCLRRRRAADRRLGGSLHRLAGARSALSGGRRRELSGDRGEVLLGTG